MKFSEYVNKKRIPTQRKTTQFVLGNTLAESKLQNEVSDLNSEITRLRSVQQDRDDAVSKLTHEKTKFKEASIIFDKTKEENFLLHKNIEFLNKQIKELEKTKVLYKETSSMTKDLAIKTIRNRVENSSPLEPEVFCDIPSVFIVELATPGKM